MEFSNSGEQFACYQSIRRDIALYDLKGQNAINPQNKTITVINNYPTIFLNSQRNYRLKTTLGFPTYTLWLHFRIEDRVCIPIIDA